MRTGQLLDANNYPPAKTLAVVNGGFDVWQEYIYHGALSTTRTRTADGFAITTGAGTVVGRRAGGISSPTTIYSQALTLNGAGNAGSSYRQVLPASKVTKAGCRVRLTMQAPTNGVISATHVSIGMRSGSTINTVAAPVEILFGGASGFSTAANTQIVSDWLSFQMVPGQDYLIIMDISSDGLGYNTGVGTGFYWKASATSWNVQAPSGFSDNVSVGNQAAVCKVEVDDYVANGVASPASAYSQEIIGAASVTTVDLDTRLEALNIPLIKGICSFTAQVWNGTGSAFTPQLLVSTTSSDYPDDWSRPVVRNGGGSGESLQSCPASAWTRVTWTGDISGYAHVDSGVEFKLRFPSGTLSSASQLVRVGEVAAQRGPRALFQKARFEDVLFECERNFRKSYEYSVAPGQVVSIGYGAVGFLAIASASQSWVNAQLVFPAAMRTTPNVTLYDTGGATGKCSYYNGSWSTGGQADKWVVTSKNIIFSSTTAGYIFVFNYTADCRL